MTLHRFQSAASSTNPLADFVKYLRQRTTRFDKKRALVSLSGTNEPYFSDTGRTTWSCFSCDGLCMEAAKLLG